ncbi:carboxypeptidase D [Malassezia equina]|uniref:Carboxypeptidase n=1 Tax=Malassezia equina TaxID=1381935 RepID=A0AAF0ECG3_9BASI|nr:carboxypeptidase D [Malassezia equina]
MLQALLCILTVSVLAGTSWSHFVDFPKDLTSVKSYANTTVRYKAVPHGICETTRGVKSYSGYVDVGNDEHMFFWFFESRKNPTEDPFVVWFNGGPGSSSMIGLFQEVGPCRVWPNGTLYNNVYAWNGESNLLIVDQPVTTGFSYKNLTNAVFNKETYEVVRFLDGEACPSHLSKKHACGTVSGSPASKLPNSTVDAAPTMWKILQGFFGAFPQYADTTLHIRTESYGGHYAPVYGSYILEQDKKDINDAIKLNLTSVVIGNGWIDPKIQYASYYNISAFPGNTYNVKPYNQSTISSLYQNVYGKGKCMDHMDKCISLKTDKACRKAENFCATHVEELWDDIDRDYYDMRETAKDPYPYGSYAAYLNKPHVQKAIGAAQTYFDASNAIGNAFWNTGDWARSTAPYIVKLMESGITVTLHAGDADYICNWLGVEALANELGGPQFKNAGYVDIEAGDIMTPGQVKQHGKYSFSRIYYSGHEVPWYQPVAAYHIHHRSMHGYDIATGTHKVQPHYLTHGLPKSTFREGNSTVQFSDVPQNVLYNMTTFSPVRPYKRVSSPVWPFDL